jgi:hypothetical protein
MWIPAFWDMVLHQWDPEVLRQHSALPHIQGCELFFDISTVED